MYIMSPYFSGKLEGLVDLYWTTPTLCWNRVDRKVIQRSRHVYNISVFQWGFVSAFHRWAVSWSRRVASEVVQSNIVDETNETICCSLQHGAQHFTRCFCAGQKRCEVSFNVVSCMRTYLLTTRGLWTWFTALRCLVSIRVLRGV